MKKKISRIVSLALIISVIQSPLFASSAQAVSGQENKGQVVTSTQKASQDNKVQGKRPFLRHKRRDSNATNGANAAKDIVEIASENNQFKTLVAALKAADLVDTLKGEGPFTVFAPTDEAFAKLAPGTLDELLKPENKGQLTNILTYHVLKDSVKAADVVGLNGKEVTMANGAKARIEIRDGVPYINGAKVIMTDIIGKNGVIHVIDTVMLPQ